MRRRRRGSVMPAKFLVLATYNAEVARGVVHTGMWCRKMEQLQREFDEWCSE